MVGEAGGAEVVAAGLDGHAVAQRAEADLALKVLQRTDVGRCVSRGSHPLHQRLILSRLQSTLIGARYVRWRIHSKLARRIFTRCQ